MSSIHTQVMQLIIGYTCVGVFVTTAIAILLNLFGLLKLEKTIRTKLQVTLIGEVVTIAIAVFSGLMTINPTTASQQIDVASNFVAERLENSMSLTHGKGGDDADGNNDSSLVYRRIRHAVFLAMPDYNADKELLNQALKLLETRGESDELINEQIISEFPELRRQRLRWIQDKVIPALKKAEVEIEQNPMLQLNPAASVELPEIAQIISSSRASVTVVELDEYESEVTLLKKSL